MDFQYFAPTRLIIGPGRRKEAGPTIKHFGTKAFLISSGSVNRNGILSELVRHLNQHAIEVHEYIKPTGEPTAQMTDQATEEARRSKCDIVLSIGGGSVIDLGKAVCALVHNDGSVEDYLEGVGRGQQVVHPVLPHVAIPTTAGTGAEVTRNEVIRSCEKRYKKSFRHPSLCPTVAILDAELTLNLPSKQTAYSGMDTITQLIESYLSQKANPITDVLALLGLRMALRSIRQAVQVGDNLEARAEMLLASTLSGICLANAGLGLAWQSGSRIYLQLSG
jgi:alcohol dehydrogenase class IV